MSRRVDIKSIISEEDMWKDIAVRIIMSNAEREGGSCSKEQAETAYLNVKAEGKHRWRK